MTLKEARKHQGNLENASNKAKYRLGTRSGDRYLKLRNSFAIKSYKDTKEMFTCFEESHNILETHYCITKLDSLKNEINERLKFNKEEMIQALDKFWAELKTPCSVNKTKKDLQKYILIKNREILAMEDKTKALVAEVKNLRDETIRDEKTKWEQTEMINDLRYRISSILEIIEDMNE